MTLDAESQLKYGRYAVNFLPVMDMIGWSNPSAAVEHYFHWRSDKDLIAALVELSGCRKSSEREILRNEIIQTFYGGHEKYRLFCKNLISSMCIFNDITKKQ